MYRQAGYDRVAQDRMGWTTWFPLNMVQTDLDTNGHRSGGTDLWCTARQVMTEWHKIGWAGLGWFPLNMVQTDLDTYGKGSGGVEQAVQGSCDQGPGWLRAR